MGSKATTRKQKAKVNSLNGGKNSGQNFEPLRFYKIVSHVTQQFD